MAEPDPRIPPSPTPGPSAADPSPEGTKADLKAQLHARASRITGRLDALKDEADPMATAREKAAQARDFATEHAEILAGSALGIGVLVALLLSRSGSGDASEVPVQRLDDRYVGGLTQRLAARLNRGEALHEALGRTLRAQAPIVLREPEGPSGSIFGTLLKAGLVTGLAFGANYALEAFTGKGLGAWVADQMGDEPDYPPVHGTAGAEMPDPPSTG